MKENAPQAGTTAADNITPFDRVLIAKCRDRSRWEYGFVWMCVRLADTPEARDILQALATEKRYDAEESI